jgi:hypothetical protein
VAAQREPFIMMTTVIRHDNSYRSFNSTQQTPSRQSDTSSARTEIPRILWSAKDHCRFHRNPPLVPVGSQVNTVHIFPSYYFKISFNIIPHLRTGLVSGHFLSGHPTRYLYALLLLPIKVTRPAPLTSPRFYQRYDI